MQRRQSTFEIRQRILRRERHDVDGLPFPGRRNGVLDFDSTLTNLGLNHGNPLLETTPRSDRMEINRRGVLRVSRQVARIQDVEARSSRLTDRILPLPGLPGNALLT
jgi:hypothetical protein